MGIVNVTPDSFQRVGRCLNMAAAVGHGLSLAADGADLLDIGGESTRPGASAVSTEEEIARVVPVVRALSKATGTPISVDTRNADVAAAAIDAGARIVNDVSAGRHDQRMFATVAERGAFLCLMHGPLDLRTMGWSTATSPPADDIMDEVMRFLQERAEAAIAAGVAEDQIWLDPGFGFGKSVPDNLQTVRDLRRLTALRWPVLLGASRKSTLGAVLNGAPPEERLEATLAVLALGVLGGAAILRVHDVKAAVCAVRMADAVVYGASACRSISAAKSRSA
jgi:dihydropteroate synthase